MVPWPSLATIQNPGQSTNPHTGEPEGESSWADDDREDFPDRPCLIQPRTSIEATATGAVVVGGWVSAWPADETHLTSASRIAWRGFLLEVDGDVAPVEIRGAVHHLEANLKEWSQA